MAKPHPIRRPVRSARLAMSPAFGFAPNRIAVAVRNALLLGLAFGTLTIAMSPVQAQTPSTSLDTSEKQSPAPTAEEVTTLPTVTVTGESTTLTYAGGQVSTGSRMGLLGEKDFMETPFSTITYTDKYMADIQAMDIQEVISKTDPAVFMSGVSGEHLESY